ncbi:hypothetical protein O6H91_22G045400 [Diphasiastrum complanatum]|uniref:Uncharacterized protein n=3 Tax=Diphasiastrum complanatum TaxID=34168 RepID=A0ACC2AF11_DIPCM|nr:hypothetical protein O6H91_22G045400 [Diphasiastrum complanatum]
MAPVNISFVSDMERQNCRVAENEAGKVLEDEGYYVQIPDKKADYAEFENPEFRSLGNCIRFRSIFLTAICIALIMCLSLLICLSQPGLAPSKSVKDTAWSKQSASKFLMPSIIKGESLPSFADERTSFHFQPERNWMNDPNGPMFYKGYYHFFYQYNPDAAVWGNITWGHSVSTDLIHWHHLELALVPDQWYDVEGVWSGSATILPDGKPVILYTGSSNESLQSQNKAVPEDLSDPLLRKWVKVSQNPMLVPPPGIGHTDFRDPTTAWLESDGLWRIAIGAKEGTTGLALVYKTSDFLNWTLQRSFLHQIAGTGMWECVDFYPVSLTGTNGLDTSKVQGNQLVKHVLKASLDSNKHDYYTIGTYSTDLKTFVADDPTRDVGLGLRYDYGKFYASKTFYDPAQERRILWGWANESDSQLDDIKKGWASVQTIPRTLVLDHHTGSNLLQWPISELDSLRGDKVVKQDILLDGGAMLKVDGASGAQLDIEVTFKYPDVQTLDVPLEQKECVCSQGGAAQRGVFGPFGLLVLAADDLVEQTAVYFYLTLRPNGKWMTTVCSDQSRSSLAKGIDRTVYGTSINIAPTENFLSLRLIVDHSIVETFVQQGIACITSRVYPTLAVERDAHVLLFNNGSESIAMHTLEIWQMSNA